MNDKIMIAMSGGVDSSVTAYLSMKKSDDVAGATMKLLDEYDPADAESVTKKLGIPFYVFDFRSEFQSCVIEPFINTYKAGATPNPCIECNRYLKFDLFYKRMKELGYNKLATGHYARIEFDEHYNRNVLKKALDPAKDQSYVLYSLSLEQLDNTFFPLGELTKEQVRSTALKQGFENANKKESQDICFVPDGDYSRYIEEYSGDTFSEGDFVDLNGNVLGRHKGIIRYTIGQRKGLGLALPEPMYVCEKNIPENKVVLCRNDELFGDTVTANNINLIAVDSIAGSMRVKAKIRYSQVEQPATVTQVDDGTLRIVFDEPQRAIAKGQSVVMYDDDIVVGGGTIV